MHNKGPMTSPSLEGHLHIDFYNINDALMVQL